MKSSPTSSRSVPKPKGSRSATASCSTRGCRAGRVACRRCVPRAQSATSACAARSPSGRSRPASTPARRSDASGGYAELHARARLDAVQGARRRPRRARGVRRSVRGVAARDHAAPADAGRQGRWSTARVRSARARPRSCAALYPDVDVLVVARFEAQAEMARKLGATVIGHAPALAVIEEAAAWSGGVLQRERRAADGVSRRHRRRLRHDRQAGDVRGRRPGC